MTTRVAVLDVGAVANLGWAALDVDDGLGQLRQIESELCTEQLRTGPEYDERIDDPVPDRCTRHRFSIVSP